MSGSVAVSDLSSSNFSVTTPCLEVTAATNQNTMAAIVQLAPVEIEQLSENPNPLLPKLAASCCNCAMSVLSLHNALFNSNNDNPENNAATIKAGASNFDVLRNGDTHAEMRFAKRNTPPKIIAT